MLGHLRPQRRLVLGSPVAKTSARFETKLPFGNNILKIRRRSRPAVDSGQYGAVNREREIGSHEVGIFERSKHGEPASEARLDHGIDGFGIADVVLDESNGFAPECVLQAIADE